MIDSCDSCKQMYSIYFIFGKKRSQVQVDAVTVSKEIDNESTIRHHILSWFAGINSSSRFNAVEEKKRAQDPLNSSVD